MDQINSLVKVINHNLQHSKLQDLYPWNLGKLMSRDSTQENTGLTQSQIREIADGGTPFEQNKMLKQYLHERLSGYPLNFELLFWIIRDWGGIQAFKKNDTNKNRIEEFYKEIIKSKPISPKLFKIISSLSKSASFWDPAMYAIYDNRAIYTLNYLIKLARDSGAIMKYFPISGGSRNKMIMKKPVEHFISNKSVDFFDETIAYYEYCKLLQQINEKLYPDSPNEIFRTEMLLFSSIEVPFLAMGGELHKLTKTSQKIRNSKNMKIMEPLTLKKKYYFLQSHLMNAAASDETTVSLSIKEINKLIGRSGKGELPKSAYTYQPFWGNDVSSPTHVWKAAWLSQGFVVTNTTNVINAQRKEDNPVPENGIITFDLVNREKVSNYTSNTDGVEGELKADLSRLYSKIKEEVPNNTPQYFYELLQKSGPIQVAESLLNSAQKSDGFTILNLLGRLDLTVEFLIVNQTKYHALFTPEIIEMAKKRIGR